MTKGSGDCNHPNLSFHLKTKWRLFNENNTTKQTKIPDISDLLFPAFLIRRAEKTFFRWSPRIQRRRPF
jgi:hypothetical protein